MRDQISLATNNFKTLIQESHNELKGEIDKGKERMDKFSGQRWKHTIS